MSRKRTVNAVTRQGVRDLNSLPGKSRGYRLPDMPGEVDANCKHHWVREELVHGFSFAVCSKCKVSHDNNY